MQAARLHWLPVQAGRLHHELTHYPDSACEPGADWLSYLTCLGPLHSPTCPTMTRSLWTVSVCVVCWFAFAPQPGLAAERPAGHVRARHPADPRPGPAATPGPATARPAGRTASSCRCSASTPTSTTTPSPREARGRRVFPAAPGRSACCCARRPARCRTAAASGCPTDDPDYARSRRWIAAGTPRTPADAPKLDAHHRRAGRAHPGLRARRSSSPSPPTTPTARPRT